jgi:hypothetical protein
MTFETTDMDSIAVLDKKRIDAFVSKPDFPFLISFPRTGSHWLRMVMELYFETPSLVRIFYYKDAKDFTCYHRHDEDLNIERENVIYLYRHPVDTIYSNLYHYGESLDDKKRVQYRSNLYGLHLKKWLLEENFTTRKTIITYEGMKKDMDSEFQKICRHFSVPFEQGKLHEALCRVTKKEVQTKTTHDPRVINLSKNYLIKKEEFKQKQAALIMDCIYSVDPGLEKFIIVQ